MGCLVCGKDWEGVRRCHCATCHENFRSATAFDRHRVAFACHKPASRGLRLGRDGCWALPEGSVTQAKRHRAA